MNRPEKSYRLVVPVRPANKAGRPVAESVEGRGLAKGNLPQSTTNRIQGRSNVHRALERIRRAAKREKGKEVKFTSLLHHIYSVDMLREAYYSLERNADPGVDGETWQHYGEALEDKLRDLSERLTRGGYRARPVRRAYVPKADGRQRPIGVPALEDKVVQRATAAVLNGIYETEFLGFSYSFRPGRSQHHALAALDKAIMETRVNYVLDADLQDYFGTIDWDWLIRFVEHKIGDKRVVRLIRNWLRAGVLEDGVWTQEVEGTPQGGSISPLMSNVYLHYVFDLWVQQWRKKRAHGDVVVVRFADDFIVGFQRWSDAEQFVRDLKDRFQRFNLTLHPEKTRLIEFGRFAAQSRQQRGLGRPETFDFLGFTHSCGKTRNGKYTVLHQTTKARMRAKLTEVHRELRRRFHLPIPEVGRWLQSVVSGHFRYYGVTGNSRALSVFRQQVAWLWHRCLERRSHKAHVPWEKMARLRKRWLPLVRIYHTFPPVRQLQLKLGSA